MMGRGFGVVDPSGDWWRLERRIAVSVGGDCLGKWGM
jgi:hypothetical protein